MMVTAVFENRAISGANSARTGYRGLLQAARRGGFDVVIVEAVDRLARKLSDLAAAHDELQFNRMSLHAVNTGPITTMHIGMLGTGVHTGHQGPLWLCGPALTRTLRQRSHHRSLGGRGAGPDRSQGEPRHA
jgi:hypothetical protein